MESQSVLDSSTPLLKDAYAYGVVEHPFPLNCLIGDWPLGPTFYHAVKVGIVQYVCTHFLLKLYFNRSISFKVFSLIWSSLTHYFPDDTEIDLRFARNDS